MVLAGVAIAVTARLFASREPLARDRNLWLRLAVVLGAEVPLLLAIALARDNEVRYQPVVTVVLVLMLSLPFLVGGHGFSRYRRVHQSVTWRHRTR